MNDVVDKQKLSVAARVALALHQSLVLRSGLLIILWLGIWQLGRLLEYTDHASVWFPAAGLTYAALLVIGHRAIIPIAISGILITYWIGSSFNPAMTRLDLLLAGVLFSAAHITPYYLASVLIRRMSLSGRFSIPQLIVSFLVSCAMVTLLTTFLVIYALVFCGMMHQQEVAATWLPFWIGDMAGVVVVGPLFCALIALFYPKPMFDVTRYVGHENFLLTTTFVYKMGVTLMLLSAAMLLTYFADNRQSAFAIFFLVIPHMWIASTESAFLNTISLALSSCLIAFWVSALGLMEYALVYQFAINVIAANALFGIALPTLAADNRELRRQVTTDSLTQAASRDYLIKRARLEISRSHQEHSNLSIIVFDVDHFKFINDNLGHAKGDDALRFISQTAKLLLRPSDLLGRFGGDEFVAVLPNTNLASAHQIANRILNEISRMTLDGHAITTSFGIAQLLPEEDFSQIFERADQSLYQAKKQGRNCIVGFNEPA